MKIHDDEVLCQAMAVTTDRYVVQAPVAISFQIAAIFRRDIRVASVVGYALNIRTNRSLQRGGAFQFI